MTDARLPERYLLDRRIGRLTDSEFRSFVTATVWSVSNRTDGVIVADDLALIPRFITSAVLTFVTAGLWIQLSEGRWLIADFADTQTSKHELEVIENARRRDREKKARQRAAKAAVSVTVSTVDSVPGDIPGDASPGQHRQGKARTGKRVADNRTPETDAEDWHVATIPNGQPDACSVCRDDLPDAAARRSGLCSKTDARHDRARRAA